MVPSAICLSRSVLKKFYNFPNCFWKYFRLQKNTRNSGQLLIISYWNIKVTLFHVRSVLLRVRPLRNFDLFMNIFCFFRFFLNSTHFGFCHDKLAERVIYSSSHCILRFQKMTVKNILTMRGRRWNSSLVSFNSKMGRNSCFSDAYAVLRKKKEEEKKRSEGERGGRRK